MTNLILNQDYKNFVQQLKNRVASTRYQAARTVNRELILLYHYISTEILAR